MDLGEGIKKYFEEFKCDRKLRLKISVVSVLITVVMTWLFYEKVLGMLLFPVFFVYVMVFYVDQEKSRQKSEFLCDYQEFLCGLLSWITTGLSIEQAFLKEEEVLLSYVGQTEFVKGLKRVNQAVSMNRPIEQAFYEFAYESTSEEIWDFAEVFVFSKRLGSGYIENIKLGADKLIEEVEIKRSIEADSYEKSMEMKIMCVVPLVFLLFLKVASYDFVEPVYRGLAGVAFMSVVLILYLSSVAIAYRIVRKGEVM